MSIRDILCGAAGVPTGGWWLGKYDFESDAAQQALGGGRREIGTLGLLADGTLYGSLYNSSNSFGFDVFTMSAAGVPLSVRGWTDGISSQTIFDLKVDPSGNYYMLTSGGAHGHMLIKFDSAWNFVWTTSLTGMDTASQLAIDAGGNVFVSGAASATVSYVDGRGTTQTQTVTAAAVTKYSPAGVVLWRSRVAGSRNTNPTDISVGAIALDGSGNVFVFGGPQGVLVKMNGATGAVIWQTLISTGSYLGGSTHSLVVDNFGRPTLNLTYSITIVTNRQYVRVLTFNGSTGAFVMGRQIENAVSNDDGTYMNLRADGLAYDPASGFFFGGAMMANSQNQALVFSLDASLGLRWAKRITGIGWNFTTVSPVHSFIANSGDVIFAGAWGAGRMPQNGSVGVNFTADGDTVTFDSPPIYASAGNPDTMNATPGFTNIIDSVGSNGAVGSLTTSSPTQSTSYLRSLV